MKYLLRGCGTLQAKDFLSTGLSLLLFVITFGRFVHAVSVLSMGSCPKAGSNTPVRFSSQDSTKSLSETHSAFAFFARDFLGFVAFAASGSGWFDCFRQLVSSTRSLSGF